MIGVRISLFSKMISESTKVNIIDNSGAIQGKCIKILTPKSFYGRRIGKVGDTIVLTITKTISGSKIKTGDIMKALIVRTKKGNFSYCGYREMFGDNCVVLIKQPYIPIGSRIKGPISEWLKRGKEYKKLVSILN